MHYKFEKPVQGTIGTEKYQCAIEWRNGKFISDEPEKTGGKDLGPDPHTLLLSSLISCTLVTLRMYIDRKQWDVPVISIKANLFQTTQDDKITTFIDRDISFPGPSPLDPEKKARLLEIALHFAREGREGSSIGAIFVLGDRRTLSPHLRQLILNPLKGHAPAVRSIHNPDFLETLRELAATRQL